MPHPIALMPPSRLHRRYLGFTGLQAVFNRHTAPVEALCLDADLRELLEVYIDGAGPARGGLMYGCQAQATLFVSHFAPGGYPQIENSGGPLTIDARYALGWIDALRLTVPQPVDWVGMWAVHAGARFGDTALDAGLWLQAREQGMVSAQHALVIIGRDAQGLQLKACTDTPAGVPIEWGEDLTR